MKIGDLAKKASVSVDTLRYYEKIGLLKGIQRSSSGYRNYNQQNVEQVKFIRNAQHSGFTLDEITHLLSFRCAPVEAKPQVRELAENKVAELSAHIDDLIFLRNELKALVEQCANSNSFCPIINNFNNRDGEGSDNDKER